MKDEVIGSKKPKRVSKSPWEHKIRKRVKDAKGKQIGQGCLRGDKWDKKAHKQCNKKAQNSMSMNSMTILSH